MADTVETGWSMEGNLGEGTNIGGQREGFTTNMQVSRKRRRDQGCSLGPGGPW